MFSLLYWSMIREVVFVVFSLLWVADGALPVFTVPSTVIDVSTKFDDCKIFGEDATTTISY